MKELKLSAPKLAQLYRDVGEEAGLQKILDRFYERMSTDVLIGFFFDGKDLKHIARMQKSFLMRAWGASPSYTGKTPAKAHEELAPILSGHFDRRLRILEETLSEFGVSDENAKIWVAFEGSFRKAVQHG